MHTFNIFGTCILRDVFSLGNTKDCSVKRFLQSSHPVVNFIYNTKPDNELQMERFDDNEQLKSTRNFCKKCVVNDYNKTVMDYLGEKSDFFFTGSSYDDAYSLGEGNQIWYRALFYEFGFF